MDQPREQESHNTQEFPLGKTQKHYITVSGGNIQVAPSFTPAVGLSGSTLSGEDKQTTPGVASGGETSSQGRNHVTSFSGTTSGYSSSNTVSVITLNSQSDAVRQQAQGLVDGGQREGNQMQSKHNRNSGRSTQPVSSVNSLHHQHQQGQNDRQFVDYAVPVASTDSASVPNHGASSSEMNSTASVPEFYQLPSNVTQRTVQVSERSKGPSTVQGKVSKPSVSSPGHSAATGYKCQDQTSTQLKHFLQSSTDNKDNKPSFQPPSQDRRLPSPERRLPSPERRPESLAAESSPPVPSSVPEDEDELDYIPVGIFQMPGLRQPVEGEENVMAPSHNPAGSGDWNAGGQDHQPLAKNPEIQSTQHSHQQQQLLLQLFQCAQQFSDQQAVGQKQSRVVSTGGVSQDDTGGVGQAPQKKSSGGKITPGSQQKKPRQPRPRKPKLTKKQQQELETQKASPKPAEPTTAALSVVQTGGDIRQLGQSVGQANQIESAGKSEIEPMELVNQLEQQRQQLRQQQLLQQQQMVASQLLPTASAPQHLPISSQLTPPSTQEGQNQQQATTKAEGLYSQSSSSHIPKITEQLLQQQWPVSPSVNQQHPEISRRLNSPASPRQLSSSPHPSTRVGSPRQMPPSPQHMPTSPRQRTTSPRQMTTSPGQMISNQWQHASSPRNLSVSPCQFVSPPPPAQGVSRQAATFRLVASPQPRPPVSPQLQITSPWPPGSPHGQLVEGSSSQQKAVPAWSSHSPAAQVSRPPSARSSSDQSPSLYPLGQLARYISPQPSPPPTLPVQSPSPHHHPGHYPSPQPSPAPPPQGFPLSQPLAEPYEPLRPAQTIHHRPAEPQSSRAQAFIPHPSVPRSAGSVQRPPSAPIASQSHSSVWTDQREGQASSLPLPAVGLFSSQPLHPQPGMSNPLTSDRGSAPSSQALHKYSRQEKVVGKNVEQAAPSSLPPQPVASPLLQPPYSRPGLSEKEARLVEAFFTTHMNKVEGNQAPPFQSPPPPSSVYANVYTSENMGVCQTVIPRQSLLPEAAKVSTHDPNPRILVSGAEQGVMLGDGRQEIMASGMQANSGRGMLTPELRQVALMSDGQQNMMTIPGRQGIITADGMASKGQPGSIPEMRNGPATAPSPAPELRKNEGGLKVLSEIASERYVLAVSGKESDDERSGLGLNRNTNGQEMEGEKSMEESGVGEEISSVESQGGGQKSSEDNGDAVEGTSGSDTSGKKVSPAVVEMVPRREIRKRKPKKPFESIDTPTRSRSKSFSEKTQSQSKKVSSAGSNSSKKTNGNRRTDQTFVQTRSGGLKPKRRDVGRSSRLLEEAKSSSSRRRISQRLLIKKKQSSNKNNRNKRYTRLAEQQKKEMDMAENAEEMAENGRVTRSSLHTSGSVTPLSMSESSSVDGSERVLTRNSRGKLDSSLDEAKESPLSRMSTRQSRSPLSSQRSRHTPQVSASASSKTMTTRQSENSPSASGRTPTSRQSEPSPSSASGMTTRRSENRGNTRELPSLPSRGKRVGQADVKDAGVPVKKKQKKSEEPESGVKMDEGKKENDIQAQVEEVKSERTEMKRVRRSAAAASNSGSKTGPGSAPPETDGNDPKGEEPAQKGLGKDSAVVKNVKAAHKAVETSSGDHSVKVKGSTSPPSEVVDDSKPRPEHRDDRKAGGKMLVYRLVPTWLDKEDPLYAEVSDTMLPVTGYLVPGSPADRILLPQSVMLSGNAAGLSPLSPAKLGPVSQPDQSHSIKAQRSTSSSQQSRADQREKSGAVVAKETGPELKQQSGKASAWMDSGSDASSGPQMAHASSVRPSAGMPVPKSSSQAESSVAVMPPSSFEDRSLLSTDASHPSGSQQTSWPASSSVTCPWPEMNAPADWPRPQPSSSSSLASLSWTRERDEHPVGWQAQRVESGGWSVPPDGTEIWRRTEGHVVDYDVQSASRRVVEPTSNVGPVQPQTEQTQGSSVVFQQGRRYDPASQAAPNQHYPSTTGHLSPGTFQTSSAQLPRVGFPGEMEDLSSARFQLQAKLTSDKLRGPGYPAPNLPPSTPPGPAANALYHTAPPPDPANLARSIGEQQDLANPGESLLQGFLSQLGVAPQSSGFATDLSALGQQDLSLLENRLRQEFSFPGMPLDVELGPGADGLDAANDLVCSVNLDDANTLDGSVNMDVFNSLDAGEEEEDLDSTGEVHMADDAGGTGGEGQAAGKTGDEDKNKSETKSDAKTKSSIIHNKRRHLYEFIQKDGKRVCRCLLCNNNYSYVSIHRHLRIHDDSRFTLQCPICGKKYSQEYSLKAHMEKQHAGKEESGTDKSPATAKEDSKASKKSKRRSRSSEGKIQKDNLGEDILSGFQGRELERKLIMHQLLQEFRQWKKDSKGKELSEPFVPTVVPPEPEVVDPDKEKEAREKLYSSTIENIVAQTNYSGEEEELQKTEEEQKEGEAGQKEGLVGTSKEGGMEKEEPKEKRQEFPPTVAVSLDSIHSDGSSLMSPPGVVFKSQEKGGGDVGMPSHEAVLEGGERTKGEGFGRDVLVTDTFSGKQTEAEVAAALNKGAESVKGEMSSSEKEGESSPEKLASPQRTPMRYPEMKDGKYTCPQCGNQLASKASYAMHWRRHKRIKSHQCSHCDMAFITSNELRSHERRHTGERPFTCPICYMTFAHTGSFIVHKRGHTKRGETVPFPTQNGKAVFPNKSPRKQGQGGKEGVKKKKKKPTVPQSSVGKNNNNNNGSSIKENDNIRNNNNYNNNNNNNQIVQSKSCSEQSTSIAGVMTMTADLDIPRRSSLDSSAEWQGRQAGLATIDTGCNNARRFSMEEPRPHWPGQGYGSEHSRTEVGIASPYHHSSVYSGQQLSGSAAVREEMGSSTNSSHDGSETRRSLESAPHYLGSLHSGPHYSPAQGYNAQFVSSQPEDRASGSKQYKPLGQGETISTAGSVTHKDMYSPFPYSPIPGPLSQQVYAEEVYQKKDSPSSEIVKKLLQHYNVPSSSYPDSSSDYLQDTSAATGYSVTTVSAPHLATTASQQAPPGPRDHGKSTQHLPSSANAPENYLLSRALFGSPPNPPPPPPSDVGSRTLTSLALAAHQVEASNQMQYYGTSPVQNPESGVPYAASSRGGAQAVRGPDYRSSGQPEKGLDQPQHYQHSLPRIEGFIGASFLKTAAGDSAGERGENWGAGEGRPEDQSTQEKTGE